MKTKTLERLENLLAHWEDYCEMSYLAAILHKACPQIITLGIPIDEPLIHVRTLRRFILDSRNEHLDVDRYVYGKSDRFAEMWFDHNPLATFPLTLFNWCRHSRRAYNLSGELTDLLLMTKVDDVLWDDIKFPFPAFIIELEDGFIDLDGCTHNFILVNCMWEEEKNKLVLTSVGTKDGKLFPVVGQHKFLGLRMAIQHRQYLKAGVMLNQMNDLSNIEVSGFVAPFHVENGKTVADSMRERREYAERNAANKDPKEFMDSLNDIEANVLRIVVGFTMYLRTLPENSPHAGVWQDLHVSKKNTHSVTHGATICEVTSSVRLSQTDRKSLREQIAARGKGYELRAHFREGHWRRPPGKGSDPTAEKTVWVKPCIVRADRLEGGETPVGLEQKYSGTSTRQGP